MSTDEEIKGVIEDLLKLYGDRLVNPEQYPECFKHQLRLVAHVRNNRKKSTAVAVRQ